MRAAGRARAALALAALASLAAGCTKEAPKRPKADEAEVASVVAGNNAFAFDLYARLREGEGNLVFSPYSISTALAMTYAGARGETEKQMGKTLHFTLGQQRLHSATADLIDDMNARGGEGRYELAVANRLWPRLDKPLVQAFVTLCSDLYGAGLERLDFGGDAHGSAQAINRWTARNTRDRIRKLVEARDVAGVALVLTNAIYFKGNWASRFEKRRTRDEPFNVTASEQVTVPMMHQTGDFMNARAEGLAILEMPYVGDELSMVILLPEKVEGLSQVESRLSVSKLEEWFPRLRRDEVAVALPRFRIEWGTKVREALSRMGMAGAFGPAADFSGITPEELWLDEVIHRAFVDVNEEGTEAAAATAVVSVDGAPMTFRVDRPFFFLIRDRKTGSILFIGRVTDPRA